MYPIGRFRGGAKGGPCPPLFSTTNTTILLWKSFYKMLFNSIFRNVIIALLCITNMPTLLNAACPEKWKFHSRVGGRVGDSAPSFWIFWIRPCIQNGLLSDLSITRYLQVLTCAASGLFLVLCLSYKTSHSLLLRVYLIVLRDVNGDHMVYIRIIFEAVVCSQNCIASVINGHPSQKEIKTEEPFIKWHNFIKKLN